MMRAKFFVTSVEKPYDGAEKVNFSPVTSKPFDGEGNSEDNTYSRWTPSGALSLTITNPALHGKFTQGQKFYADFTEAAE